MHTTPSFRRSRLRCRKHNVQAIAISLVRKSIFGSDEEQALTKAIESVFPSSIRTNCSKHLKDNVLAYMQNEAGIPQKDQQRIASAIFDDDGASTADDPSLFDKRSGFVLKLAKNYSKFQFYCKKNINTVLKNYVVFPANENSLSRDWTTNNCESINQIMKLHAKWKPGNTSQMIELLHEITLLHFRDFRLAYGGGYYHMVVAIIIWWWLLSYGGGYYHMVVAIIIWWWLLSYGGGYYHMVVAIIIWWWLLSYGGGYYHMVVVVAIIIYYHMVVAIIIWWWLLSYGGGYYH